MIAQLADTQPAGEVEKLKCENKELQRRMEELESSSAKESSRLEADLQKARNENEVAKHQSEREKRKMQTEIEETKKELHMKAAALQSLMLATQVRSLWSTVGESILRTWQLKITILFKDANKAERLKEENEEMAKLLEETEAALAASKRELEAKNEEIVQLRKSSEESSASSKQLEDFERKLREAEKVLETEVASKESLMKSCEELIADGKKAEEKINEWETKYSEAQKTIDSLKEDIVRLEKEASEEAAQNRRWEFERDEEVKTLTERLLVLETTLKEKDSKIDGIRVQLLAAESKAEQAEADMKAKEQLVINAERRAQQLQAQLDAKGSVELLRDELKKAEERHDTVVARLQKSEAAALEASQGQKQVVEQLKKKLEEASESETETETKMAKLQEELQSSKKELDATKETVKKFEAELAELQTEKKKLESKASVADELTTLMASLSAVRAENGQFQEEIRLLHNQLEEVKDELERSLEESDEWKSRAETAEKEKEMLEAQMSKEHERVVALTSSEASHLAHEAELSSSTSKLQSENTKLQEETKDLRAELERVQTEQKAAEEESMRKLRELTEKCEAIQKEADTSRSRVGALEAHLSLAEEQNRFRDAADQEKKRLLEAAEKQREKVEELQGEVIELRKKLKQSEEVTAAEVERYNTACTRLADVEREYEEMKLTLQNTQGLSKQSSEKLQESESFAVRIKQQLEELEREKAIKLKEMAAEHKAHQDRYDSKEMDK
ncbi:putative DNA-directed RNA polymerase, omega subunit [Ancylostoma duodenale]|uniref:Putative DNA-directed RNA polymerase, omega subunit n=2 Tax=Ancylostoma TaxID=29169 RepID=A0A0C2G760_9BILA|nr:putative DNA-directed RNA polymerase, omega subunit [Ancylostoma duodenale]